MIPSTSGPWVPLVTLPHYSLLYQTVRFSGMWRPGDPSHAPPVSAVADTPSLLLSIFIRAEERRFVAWKLLTELVEKLLGCRGHCCRGLRALRDHHSAVFMMEHSVITGEIICPLPGGPVRYYYVVYPFYRHVCGVPGRR
jgi:hypothetical protein